MILRFTEKLSKKLRTVPLTRVEEDPGPYLDWYAHLFTSNRIQYILTTEAHSLLTIVMYGRGITSDGIFLRYFFSDLEKYLDDIGGRMIVDRIIAPRAGRITLSRTVNRSVLCSMNDMVNISRIMLAQEECSPWDLAEFINDTPFKAIEYQKPRDAFHGLELK